MNEWSTIRVNKETKERLESLRENIPYTNSKTHNQIIEYLIKKYKRNK